MSPAEASHGSARTPRAELDTKRQQLIAQKRRIQGRKNARERKARTKRLIENGAIFEKAFGVQPDNEADRQRVLDAVQLVLTLSDQSAKSVIEIFQEAYKRVQTQKHALAELSQTATPGTENLAAETSGFRCRGNENRMFETSFS